MIHGDTIIIEVGEARGGKPAASLVSSSDLELVRFRSQTRKKFANGKFINTCTL